MTTHELHLMEGRCRYALQKQGLKLEKQRYTGGIYPNPTLSRYRIVGGDQTESSGYPLKIADVMQAAGLV